MGPCWVLANNDPLSAGLLTHRQTHNPLGATRNKDGIVKDTLLHVSVCVCLQRLHTHGYLCTGTYVHVHKHTLSSRQGVGGENVNLNEKRSQQKAGV